MTVREGTAMRIGASIATFNGREELRKCLLSGQSQWSFAVVVDDGSTDGTSAMLAAEFPSVRRIPGTGDLWWTGGTNAGIRRCLDEGAEYVLLCNPDVELSPGCVLKLREVASTGAIAAALVVRKYSPNTVAWGGSRWGKPWRWLPIYCSRYIVKSGTPAAFVGQEPYLTDEVHGRGVLIPRRVFDAIGLFDEKHLPHYGADSEFSLRAQAAGIQMFVVPTARALLDTEHTGMAVRSSGTFGDRLRSVWRFLTRRKNGDALHVWWSIMTRHVPIHAVVPSYAFVIGLNVWRRLVPRRTTRDAL